MPNLKSIKTFVVTEETSEEGFKLMEEHYDEQNNLLLQKQYSPEGVRLQKAERSYDSDGKLIEEKQYSTEALPDHTTIYHYDNSGKVSLEESTYRDGTVGKKVVERDEANKTITHRVLDDNDHEEAKEFRRLDEEGRLLEETLFAENNSLTQRTIRKYDDHGKILERSVEFADGFVQKLFYAYEMNDKGQLYSVIIKNDKGEMLLEDYFEYDDRGNQNVHESEDYEKKSYTVIESEYNLDNKLTKQVTTVNDQAIQEVLFTYNEHGLLQEQEVNTVNGSVLQYNKYEFFEG